MRFKLIFLVLIFIVFSGCSFFTNNSNMDNQNSSILNTQNSSNEILLNGSNTDKKIVKKTLIYNLKIEGDVFYFESLFKNKDVYFSILREDKNYACDLISNISVKSGKNIINLTNCKFEKGNNYIFDTTIDGHNYKFNVTATSDSKNLWPKQKFDEIGNIIEEDFLDGNWSTYKYDSFGKLIQLKNSRNEKWDYVYNQNDILLNLTKNYNDGNWTIIKYDKLGTVISVQESNLKKIIN